MLSRIADSLFWIGRYIERADGTARMVDVLRLSLIEDPGQDENYTSWMLLGGLRPRRHSARPVSGSAR